MVQPVQYKNVNGIVLMLINAFATSMLYVIIKYLTQFITSSQVVFIYKSLVLVGIVPWILYDGIRCVKTRKFKLHLLRGVVSTLGALCFFYGMSKVDIASATALNKMEPVLLIIVSMIYFKEKLSLSKITTVALSCFGMLLVVYPAVVVTDNGFSFPWFMEESSTKEFNYNYLIILLGVLLWTANSSVIKILGRTESNRTQLFYVSVISVLVSMPAALFQWGNHSIVGMNIPWIIEMNSFANFTPQIIGFLLCLGMLHFMHVACYFQSLKIAEMSVVAPFDYSKLVFGGILGFCFFGNQPTLSAYIGYALIIMSGIYLLKIQSKERKAQSK
ncbi:MAG: DMT family transporter [Rickettsiales bacterium]